MLRFKEVTHEYPTPRVSFEGNIVRAVADSVVRTTTQGWRAPFVVQSSIVVSQLSLLDPQSAKTLAQWAVRETSSAAREALITGAVNAAGLGVGSGVVSGAVGASWSALLRPQTCLSAGIRAGWQGAIMGACLGALTGIAQWWHLTAAANDDAYLALLVELRELFQRGNDWETFRLRYEFLERKSQSVGPVARAAWVTTQAVIDPILLEGLRARGAFGDAS